MKRFLLILVIPLLIIVGFWIYFKNEEIKIEKNKQRFLEEQFYSNKSTEEKLFIQNQQDKIDEAEAERKAKIEQFGKECSAMYNDSQEQFAALVNKVCTRNINIEEAEKCSDNLYAQGNWAETIGPDFTDNCVNAKINIFYGSN